MLFEPVWISSVEHLAEFERIYRETSRIRRLVSSYTLRPGFPHIQMASGLFGAKPMIPIAMFSQGKMQIEKQEIEFQAVDYPPINASAQRKNLMNEWNFTIKSEEITIVEPFSYDSPFLKYYSLPFTRIRTHHRESALCDFLVCVGGTGPSMSKIKEESEKLAKSLHELKKR